MNRVGLGRIDGVEGQEGEQDGQRQGPSVLDGNVLGAAQGRAGFSALREALGGCRWAGGRLLVRVSARSWMCLALSRTHGCISRRGIPLRSRYDGQSPLPARAHRCRQHATRSQECWISCDGGFRSRRWSSGIGDRPSRGAAEKARSRPPWLLALFLLLSLVLLSRFDISQEHTQGRWCAKDGNAGGRVLARSESESGRTVMRGA